MNLLQEGIANQSVIKTKLNKQLRIDGRTDTYEVYEIKLDCLYYNDQNDRIATWISKYKSDNHVDMIDMSDLDAYNSIIEGFVVASNPDAMRKTKNNIRAIGQQEYGVVLTDGRIIDGNRRFTCLRQIQRETGTTQYFKAVILPHDIEHNAKQIKMLELSLQLGVDKPVDYDPVDKLVGLYHAVAETHLITVEEYATHTSSTPKRVIADLEKAKLMIEYLEFINASGSYHLIKELNLYYPIEELYKMLKGFNDYDDRKEDIKSIVFANFTVQPEGDMTRYIRKIKKIVESPRFVNGFIDEQMPLTEEVVDVIDRQEQVNEQVLNQQLTNSELSEQFFDSTEKWRTKSQSDETRNRPAFLLDKACSNVEAIDTNIFLKMTDEQLGVVSDKLNKLSALIEQIQGELDA